MEAHLACKKMFKRENHRYMLFLLKTQKAQDFLKINQCSLCLLFVKCHDGVTESCQRSLHCC
jgi:hypothetical protein